MSLPDKDLIANWQRNSVTQQIWKHLKESLDQSDAWRNCEPEKLEYWRGRADAFDEFAKVFQIRDNS